MSGVDIYGVGEAKTKLEGIWAGAKAGEGVVGIGSDLPYAFGIETKYHRRGKLARKAGAVRYLANAWRVQAPKIPGRMARALFGGPAMVKREQRSISTDLQATARALVIVVSGALRASIEAFSPGYPARGGARWTRTGAAANPRARRRNRMTLMGRPTPARQRGR